MKAWPPAMADGAGDEFAIGWQIVCAAADQSLSQLEYSAELAGDNNVLNLLLGIEKHASGLLLGHMHDTSQRGC